MPLITLLKPGSLVFADPNKQKEHSETIAIEYITEWFKPRINKLGIDNRVLVLLSSTGSGKSTALPPTLYYELIENGKLLAGNVIVTQPRIVNAVTIPKDQIVAGGHYPYMKLGENIGWQTGPSKRLPTFGVTYATVGVLTAQFKMLSDQEIMKKYSILMIDEAHESSLELSTLLYLIKNFYVRNAGNPALPFLVIMSATIEPKKFLKYFDLKFSEVSGGVESDNYIQVSGFAYELVEKWDTINVSVVNYISAAVETVKRIHLQNLDDPKDNRDILVFMPSPGEMTEAISRIKALNGELSKQGKPILLPLLIDRPTINNFTEDYRMLFADIDSLVIPVEKVYSDASARGNDKSTRGGAGNSTQVFRRVIFGTSVLETGVTIDTLKYVCDSGYHRGPEFIANIGAGGIITKPAPKSRIRQRGGRANRKSPGEFWPLYPKYIYDALEDNQLSDMETSDISPIILTLLAQQVQNAKGDAGAINKLNTHNGINTKFIDTIDKIPSDTLRFQLEKLYACGFISPKYNYDFATISPDSNTTDLDGSDIIEVIADQKPISANGAHTASNANSTTSDANGASNANNTTSAIFGITRMGHIASLFNGLTPEQIRMIFSSYLWECSTLDMITISAFLITKFGDFRADPLKEINWVEIYKKGLPHYVTRGGYSGVIYKTKLIIADDFISGVILLQAIKNVIGGNGTYWDLEKWCEDNNLKLSSCIEFVANRDDIIEQMLQVGMNPYYGEELYKSREEDFMNNVVKIKHCLLDAFRMNIAKLDSSGSYVLPSGLKISTPPLFAHNEIKLAEEKMYGVSQKTKPKYIICENFDIKLQMPRKKRDAKTPDTSIYLIKTARVSALDGYVDIDAGFV